MAERTVTSRSTRPPASRFPERSSPWYSQSTDHVLSLVLIMCHCKTRPRRPMAVDPRRVTEAGYETILGRLVQRGYEQDHQSPAVFRKRRGSLRGSSVNARVLT